MLTRSQYEMLTQLVFARLNVPVDTQTVSVWVGIDAALKVPAAAYVRDVAEWIVRTVLAEPTPKRLIDAIQAADSQQPGYESLRAIAQRLRDEPGSWVPIGPSGAIDWAVEGDPLTVLDGRPFLDRLNFRRLLPRLGSIDTPTCTLVRGDEGSGKTYLSEFCESYAEGRRDFAVGFTKLGSSGLNSLNPRIPAIELARGLRTDLTKSPGQHADPHREARNLAAWIASYTPARSLPALAILDDFGASGLNEALHTFVLELVRLVQTDDQVAAKMRVVLLGYDPQRLTEKQLTFADHILEYVDTSFADQWLRRRYPDQPEYKYEETVNWLAAQVPAAGSMRMRTLNNFVHVASSQFQSAPP